MSATLFVRRRSQRQRLHRLSILAVIADIVLSGKIYGSADNTEGRRKPAPPGLAQVPTWSQDDLKFFLHGSMSTEVIPETVLRAFIKTYPELFPAGDLSHLGLIPDAEFGWPIGMPACRPLGNGISEVRTNLVQNRIARVLFYIDKKGRMVLLHGFIKKTPKTPDEDLELARSNKKKHQRGLR